MPALPLLALLAWPAQDPGWIEADFTLVSDLSRPVAGGLRDPWAGRALAEVGLGLDLERALGWERTRGRVALQSFFGRDGSGDVGDAQVVSNIDAPEASYLSAFWIEHHTPGGARVSVGKIDANEHFARVDAGLGFLHSSAGFSPTIFVLPTYPDPAVGAVVTARPGPAWSLSLGAFNSDREGPAGARRGLTADFEAAFLVAELERTWEHGRTALGAWRHSGRLEPADGGEESEAEGLYALHEQELWSSGPRRLSGFAQVAIEPDRVGPFERHIGAGLVLDGHWPGREEARTGLYFSRVDFAAGADEEGALELFQDLPLGPALLLKPAVQYVDDPGGRSGEVWVLNLRIEVGL